MKLIIFDIDQTLTQTDAVDSQCFLQALVEEFNLRNVNSNWAEYGHTTDSGITLQIFQEQLERSPAPNELARLQQRFVHLLKQAADQLVEVPGAAAMLQHFRQTEDWAIALATGGWRSSAQLKLQAAHLPVDGVPLASANDGISREAIVQRAIERAQALYAQTFERVVCVGDGIWDVMTAAQLRLPFVGVQSPQAIDWQQLGVTQVVTDFRSMERFLAAIDAAEVPQSEQLAAIQRQRFSSKLLPPSYFEALYQTQEDPWGFATSEYEAQKYAATLAALPQSQYRSAFEIGCSIGVLTRQLADRCQALLAVDVSQRALDRAAERCAHQPQVRFERMCVPHQFPDQQFDLVLVSEVGYYWGLENLQTAQQGILDRLAPRGHLLLVHWTEYARDYPLSGDEVHDAFMALTPAKLRHLAGQRQPAYRLDLFERL